MVLLMVAAVGFAQTTPVVVITYDDDFNGTGAKRVVKGTPQGEPVLVDGKFGKALKSGPGAGYVDYPVENIIHCDAGTIEMWVCPIDWSLKDKEFHVFFEAPRGFFEGPKGEGTLVLYKYRDNQKVLYMLSDNDASPPYTIGDSPVQDWKPGEWHHVAATWSRSQGRVVCYVDGKPGRPRTGKVPKSLSGTFRIGDAPWSEPRTSSSLIDEVRIYDRALSPEHIAAHYQGDYDFAVTPRADLAHMRYEVDPNKADVQVWLDMGGADVASARLEARIAMVPEGGAIPKDAATLSIRDGNVTTRLPLISKSVGTYEVVAEVLFDARQAFELRRRLRIPATEWKGNRIGMEDKVLPPWTPMDVHDTTVSCWGRGYAFGERALPVQITSRGKALLARPIHLTVVADGKQLTWEDETVRVAEQSDTRVELLGEMTGRAKSGDVRFSARVTAEYDGLLLLELTCDAPEALKLDAIRLDIPVKAKRALYLHRYANRHAAKSGSVSAGQGIVDQTAFVPFAWLGDNDRGLFWFCESDQYWPRGRSADAIQLVRSDGEVMLRLNLLASGETLSSDWRYVCGLQATPVKPLPKDWRKWRLNVNAMISWPAPREDCVKYFGYPEAANPEAFSRMVDQHHAQGKKVVPYLCLTHVSAAAPEWDCFGKVWTMDAGYSSSKDVADYGTAGFVKVSPLGEGYADFIVWKNKAFVERYGLDGLYHDNTVPYGSRNLEAGCGYVRDGQVHPTYPILAYRDLYRRIYAMMKSQPRQTLLVVHTSPFVTIPILAYEDLYVMGENMRDYVKESYMEVITLDQLRAAYMGRQWGLIPTFIPGLRRDRKEYYKKAVPPTRGLMALLMIHDVTPWPTLCNVSVLREAWKALDAFDHVEADFIPYWDPLPPAATDMKDVHASAYRREDGRVLLIVANLGDSDVKGQLLLNMKRLGLSAADVVSWPDKTPVDVSGGRVNIEIPRLGYRMLVLERKS